MTILIDSTHYNATRGAKLFKKVEYQHEVDYFYTINVQGKEVDLKVIEEKEDSENSTFELYYQGRFVASGNLIEFTRIKSVVENTLRVF